MTAPPCPGCATTMQRFAEGPEGSRWCVRCGAVWLAPRRRPPAPAPHGTASGEQCLECPDTALVWDATPRGAVRRCPSCTGVLLLPGDVGRLSHEGAPPIRRRAATIAGAVGTTVLEVVTAALELAADLVG